MFRRETRYYVEITAPECRLLRNCLLALRNRLIAEGRYTDAVDDLLLKLLK